MSTLYNLDRKSAAKLLGVSIRTIDRHVKSKKLSTKNVDGRVWLSKDEIESFLFGKGGQDLGQGVYVSSSESLSTNIVSEVDNAEVISPDISEKIESKDRKQSTNFDEVYKKLLFDVKEELRERQERLELANYRVGQLEAQIRNSIPLLEYHLEKERTLKKEKEFKSEIENAQKIITHVTIKERYQKRMKLLYLSIILAVLALQPLWLILQN